MASNILGKIAVMLGLDSAAFEAGTTKATKLAQKSAKDITSAFEGAGSKIGSFFEKFGEAGGPLAGAFGGLGSSVSGVMSSLGPLAGALGPIGIAALGVAAGVGAASVALIGIAVHAAGAAAELYDLSLKTGVSVETLSRLGFAAKESGVSQQTLANGLEKLGKSAFAASIATNTAITPYQRLGISVKDANGHIKDSETLLTELADKFAKMPDGPVKTAMAMQLFGKSGAEMIPLLDRGSEGIKKMSAQADILGVTLSGATAKSAKEFEEKLDLVGEAMTGIGNIVLKDLLPVMTSFMDFVDNALLKQGSQWRVLGSYLMDVMVPIIKTLASAIIIAVTAGSNLYDLLALQFKELYVSVYGLGQVMGDVFTGQFDKAKTDAKQALDTMVSMAKDSGTRIADSWKSAYASAKEMWSPQETKSATKPQGGGVDTSASNTKQVIASINEMIAKLKAQAEAERQLMLAQGQTRGATLYATAAAEGLKQVEQEEATAKKDGIKLTKQQTDGLYNAAVALSLYKAVAADANAINNLLEKTQDETDKFKTLGAAYASGSQMAIYLAEKHNALEDAVGKVDDQQEALNIAIKKGLGQTTAGAIAIATMTEKLKLEKEALKALADEYDASQQEKFSSDMAKENVAIQYNIEALQGKIAATQLGTEALREYAVQQQAQNYLQAHPGMNAISPEFEAYKKALEDQSKEEQRLSDIQSANANVRIKDLQEQIARLEELRKEYQQYGQDTTGIDAKLHEDNLTLVKDQENLLDASNRWTDGFKSGMLKITTQTQTTAQTISDAMQKMTTGITDNIALMAEGAKTSWKSMLNAISMEIEKFILSSLIQQFIKLIAGAFGSAFGGGFSAPNGLGATGAPIAPRAGGGDITPGSAYLVGEQGPELFTSSTAGSIVPNGSLGGTRNTVNYVIDARGADAGAEQRIRLALRDVENRSVARSIATVNEMNKRH